MPGVITEDAWQHLLAAKLDFDRTSSPFYDEVLLEVAGRIDAAGSVGKLDIGGLVVWLVLAPAWPE